MDQKLQKYLMDYIFINEICPVRGDKDYERWKDFT